VTTLPEAVSTTVRLFAVWSATKASVPSALKVTSDAPPDTGIARVML
jgi:hypothetical protein